MVGSGYARVRLHRRARKRVAAASATGFWASLASIMALTAAVGILAWALLSKDFRFDYVAQYTDRLLPWNYALSAFWVGQAGSLLLWAWLVGIVAAAYRLGDRGESTTIREIAFGTQMAFLCFLVTILVFAADPMQPSLVRTSGDGLVPLELQHTAMMAHPPIIFLGYAAWGVPFSLALAALAAGRLDNAWVRQARLWRFSPGRPRCPGILWGADWAYEELGWGGYWSWDPVENGLLIPWLTGNGPAARLWSNCFRGGIFKKSTMVLAFAHVCPCNFCRLPHAQRHLQQPARLQPLAAGLAFSWFGIGIAAALGMVLILLRRMP